MSAWSKQLASQVKKHGKRKASWYCEWNEPDGTRRSKSCGVGPDAKRLAELMAERIRSQIALGVYEAERRKTWEQFRSRYDARIIDEMDAGNCEAARQALEQFERLINPKLMQGITTDTIDEFIKRRRQERGRIADRVSPATVNKSLRYLRSALRVAYDWEFIRKVPKFRFLKEQKKLLTFVPPEHFAAIYRACEHADLPADIPNVSPVDWWQALLTTIYMTGWRIAQVRAILREDLDMKSGGILSRAKDNKGRRDVKVPLHPVVAEHLSKLAASFDEYVFPWNHNRRTLWTQFHKIQSEAKLTDGSPMPKAGKEGWYGFHDLRRGFATENAEEMDLFELQQLMQHRSLETTRGYVSMAKKLNRVVAELKVPAILNSEIA